MARDLTLTIISFAAFVVGGQAVQILPGNQSEPALNQAAMPEERVKDLESKFINAFVAVLDGVDQSDATRFIDDCKGLTDELTKIGHFRRALLLMERVESARLQVHKAQQWKMLLANGSSPRRPNGTFVINQTTSYTAPYGLHPSALAEWYVDRVLGLDALCETAILTGEGLDLAYHYSTKFAKAIGLVGKRQMMQRPDAATALARQTMEALTIHLSHLEVRLHKNGAVPGAYPSGVGSADEENTDE